MDTDSIQRFNELESILERLEKLALENRSFLKLTTPAIFGFLAALAFGAVLKGAAQFGMALGLLFYFMYRSDYDWKEKFRRIREEELFGDSDAKHDQNNK